jgi:mono/diheme cytochrome c family protein
MPSTTGVLLGRLAGLLTAVTLLSSACREAAPPAGPPPPPRTALLNQGWSEREAEFYNHATEGTNLAPLDLVLNLADPRNPDAKFVGRLASDYGFIPSARSALNPHALPVGFAIDERPVKFGDRAYLGITCSACHTRQLSYSSTDPAGGSVTWIVPVHGGPGLADFSRFKRDLYNAFLEVLANDGLAQRLAQGVLGRAPTADDVSAIRNEIREFSEPVVATRSILEAAKIPEPAFGPGNLNALTQGYYNNLGLMATLAKKGFVPASAGPPPLPRYEGSVNLPPMWFSHADTWAQWFAEIHHPGPRNWVQAVSTSEVRPPKMLAGLKSGVLLASIHFENIGEIQRSLEMLRTPKWPEDVFGRLDRAMVDQGRGLYQRHCARCHTRTMLPPNSLGVVFKERPAFDVGTDPTAYQQFAADAVVRGAGLQKLSDSILAFRQKQLEAAFVPEVAGNFMKLYSRGRPNQFGLAKDAYEGAADVGWTKSGAAYWASPLEGIFASSPYFHNGSVRTLWDVLTPPEQRPKAFRTGSNAFDVEGVGILSEGPFVYDCAEPGKGNGGHPFGTDLPRPERSALIEYLKSL